MVELSRSAVIALLQCSMCSIDGSPCGPAALKRIAGLAIATYFISLGYLLHVAATLFVLFEAQAIYHWWHFMYPTANYIVLSPGQPRPTASWFSRSFGLQNGRLVPSLEYLVPGRGVAVHGTQLKDFLIINTHTQIEYVANIVWRCIHRDIRHALRFSWKQATPKSTHAACYEVALNTSFAAFIDSNDLNRAHFEDIMLPRTAGLPVWRGSLTFHLDHAQQLVTSVDVAAHDGAPINVTDPAEISVLLLLVVAWVTHAVSTHWPASGVLDVAEYWPLAVQSNAFVQWFNYHAIHSSGYAYGLEVSTIQSIVMSNLSQGLPLHHHLGPLASRSKMHAMGSQARTAFLARWPTCPPGAIMSFLTATLYHSADHYYLDQLDEDIGECPSLGCNYFIFRICGTGPNYSIVRKTLCRQRRTEDAACKLLYDIAVGVDKDFADHGLFFGPVS